MIALRTGAAVAAALLVAACSVPTDDAARQIDPAVLPESLRPGVTTTPSTTVPTPETEAVTVYLLQSPPDIERRLVVEVEREVRRGASLEEILATLFGPEAVATETEREQGFSNTLFDFALLSAEVEDGMAVVDIVPLTPEGEPSEEPYPGDLVPPLAQIVFSATVDGRATGVRVLLDGEEVPLPTVAGDAAAGEVLDRSDYSRFDPEDPEATTTTDPDAQPSDTSAGAQPPETTGG